MGGSGGVLRILSSGGLPLLLPVVAPPATGALADCGPPLLLPVVAPPATGAGVTGALAVVVPPAFELPLLLLVVAPPAALLAGAGVVFGEASFFLVVGGISLGIPARRANSCTDESNWLVYVIVCGADE